MITYINMSSNHPSQIIKHLTQTVSERLSRNSSSTVIFEQSKPDYEEALKKCGYKPKLQYMQPVCSKIALEKEHGKSFGSTQLLV